MKLNYFWYRRKIGEIIDERERERERERDPENSNFVVWF